MGLRERILYGKDQDFGKWFHQECLFIQNNADVAKRQFVERGYADVIDLRNSETLNLYISNYASALFILYLLFVISADKGDEFVAKRFTPIVAVVRTVFGSGVLEIYQSGMKYISTQRVVPESAITHLLVDPLEVPLGQEASSLESAFNFLEGVLDELYIPVLRDTFAHNQNALEETLETFGHSLD